ncbi:hypothetical protein TanjilG_07319 [Lupinus angustifolius]|uniref:Uncharacterized protein n=1 Tax=Lupinus angustifolius TaxID=3871 RepID=A0A394D9Q5_LUPAN|nr:hypothetical protein TanjilG_07319 [Lupinus angustifolius]
MMQDKMHQMTKIDRAFLTETDQNMMQDHMHQMTETDKAHKRTRQTQGAQAHQADTRRTSAPDDRGTWDLTHDS